MCSFKVLLITSLNLQLKIFHQGTPKWLSRYLTIKSSGKNANSRYSELPDEKYIYFWINAWNICYWIKIVTTPSSSRVNIWIFHKKLKFFKSDLWSLFHCSMYHLVLCVRILLKLSWKIREDGVVLSRFC